MTDVAGAVSALERGELVVIPTDTVYGVAAAPTVEGAVGRLFWVKGRPAERAIPILGASVSDLAEVGEFTPTAEALAEEFWPGPLTLVIPRSEKFDVDLGGEDPDTVAVRVPDDPLALELLRKTGPLAVTSANLSGEPAAKTVEQARSVLGERVTVYLEGGEARGSGSSVVSLVAEPRSLREGDLPFDDVMKVIHRTES